MFARKRSTRTLVSLVASSLLIGVLAPHASAATKLGDYRFAGNFKNVVKGSPLQTAEIETEGMGSFQDVDVDGTMKTALVFEEGYGLRVSKIPKEARKGYSISVFFELDTITTYRRILSFGPNDRDAGLYIYDGDEIILYPVREPNIPDPVTADEWVRVIVTREAKSGAMKVYVNGEQLIRFKDSDSKFLLRKGQIVFFQDDGTEQSAGTVSNIKIHKGVITP